MCYSYVLKLPNGFFICKRGLMFDLLGNDHTIIVNCNRFDYISGEIVALERYDEIHIYSLEVVQMKNGKNSMKEIATFKTYSDDAKLYFTNNGNKYYITRDCKLHIEK